jgi:hypothetical protein
LGCGLQPATRKHTGDRRDNLVLEIPDADLFDARLCEESRIQTGSCDRGGDREAAERRPLVARTAALLPLSSCRFSPPAFIHHDLRTS